MDGLQGGVQGYGLRMHGAVKQAPRRSCCAAYG